MLKNDLVLRNPLHALGIDTGQTNTSKVFGAILARAGVGKTALLVQIALNSLLVEKRVLHVSLHDPVDKVKLWYHEVFSRLAATYEAPNALLLWETVIRHRFIMTFQAESFSVATLEERLTDLTAQGIFTPDILIVDGYPFTTDMEAEELAHLKSFVVGRNLGAWFTVLTHRHEQVGDNGLPPQMNSVAELFNTILQLQPEDDAIMVRRLTEPVSTDAVDCLRLDPKTMLLQRTDDPTPGSG